MSAEPEQPEAITPAVTPTPAPDPASGPVETLQLTGLDFVEPGISCRLDGTCD